MAACGNSSPAGQPEKGHVQAENGSAALSPAWLMEEVTPRPGGLLFSPHL